VKRTTIMLGPFQRADVVVNFGGELGKRVVLKSVARTDNPPAGSVGTPPVSIMQFRVTRAVSDQTRVPSTLETPPALTVPTDIAQTWTIDVNPTTQQWTINGQAFDPGRIDHVVTQDSTEKWQIVNNSPITHFVHLHEEQWQTVSRDGGPPKPWERGLEDTWKLDPGENIVVAAKFTDYTGPFMIHCHMLDHEDHGLMADFEVAPAGATTNPAAYSRVRHMAGMHGGMGGMQHGAVDLTKTSGLHEKAAGAASGSASQDGAPFLQKFAIRLLGVVVVVSGVWLLRAAKRRRTG
jgi:FtsP/CotA-like multicopper oxidase with cupredoxin domain